jgi:hypothetical protein
VNSDASFNGNILFGNSTIHNDGTLTMNRDVSFNSNVVVNTDGNGSMLVVNSDASFNGSVFLNNATVSGVFNNSDYRIKSNITPLGATDFSIDHLNPVFYFNENMKKNDIGFIAHELQELYPFLVNGKKDGEQIQSVNYIGLIGMLVHEIQMLKKRVEKLEKH